MSFDVMLRQMTAGFGQTCLIFFMTLIFSLPLGMLVYFGRVSRIKPISWIVKIYISIMRGTPLMLQLLVWYFAPYYLWQMNIGGYKLTAILLGCSLNYAAYFAEIYRSGIESIPKGQYEAATLLGYSRGQTFFRIVLPQMVKNVLPSVTNEVITLVKDTSLVYSLSYIEMFAVAKQIAAAQTTVLPFSTHAALFPRYKISPSSIVSSIVAQRSSVDLPEPDGPMMARISPCSTESEISRITGIPPNSFLICFISKRLIPETS